MKIFASIAYVLVIVLLFFAWKAAELYFSLPLVVIMIMGGQWINTIIFLMLMDEERKRK
jgi:hypothetical protein